MSKNIINKKDYFKFYYFVAFSMYNSFKIYSYIENISTIKSNKNRNKKKYEDIPVIR